MDDPSLWCAECGTVCGHDWRECWVHARLHGRLMGTDWGCTHHEHERTREVHIGREAAES